VTWPEGHIGNVASAFGVSAVRCSLSFSVAKIQRSHFVGIGGIGMSGIAEVLLNLVIRSPAPPEKFDGTSGAALGAVIVEGHAAQPSPARESMSPVPPSRRSTRSREDAPLGISPLISARRMLAELHFAALKNAFAIARAFWHGKTTF